MTDITYKKLKEHRDRAWDMGNKRHMDVLTDFMDYHEKNGRLTEGQIRYAQSIFRATSEQALEDMRCYENKLKTDKEYREKVRVVAEYYKRSPYHTGTATKVLYYLEGKLDKPPSFASVEGMLRNDYAKNVWISHKAEPKFQAGDLVKLRATATTVGYRESKVDSWMIIAIGAKPINTSHKYNETLGGTKRYDLLEVGGTTIITVMEKHLKKHRVPKTKKRT